MRAYIEPKVVLLNVEPHILASSHEEEETVTFTFTTETSSIWDSPNTMD